MGRSQIYANKEEAIEANNSAQKKRRDRFKDAGFKRLEIYVSESTEKQLFQLMKHCGYEDYLGNNTNRGKTLDVSTFIAFLVKDAALHQDSYEMRDEDFHDLLMVLDIYNHLKSEDSAVELKKFLNDNSFPKPSILGDKTVKNLIGDQRIKAALKKLDAEEYFDLNK